MYTPNPMHGCQTIANRKLHTTAASIITATDILINAASNVEDTGKTMIMLSTPLYRELLATLRGIAHDLNPPGLELRTSNATCESPVNHTEDQC